MSQSHETPTLILIHGAWQGAWAWQLLIPELNLRGYQAIAVDLPGNGQDDTPIKDVTPERLIEHIKRLADTIEGDIVLVGHSGGGMLATAVAEQISEKISHVIYIAGMLLPDGKTFDHIQQLIGGTIASIGVTPHIIAAQDGLTTTVPIQAAIEHFYNDCSHDQALEAAQKLTPQPISVSRFKTITTEKFAQLPKLYIHAQNDKSVLPQAQKLMQQSARNLRVVDIDSGHAPQLSQPRKLAGIIANYLSSK